jgi:hypothetical protein
MWSVPDESYPEVAVRCQLLNWSWKMSSKEGEFEGELEVGGGCCRRRRRRMGRSEGSQMPSLGIDVEVGKVCRKDGGFEGEDGIEPYFYRKSKALLRGRQRHTTFPYSLLQFVEDILLSGESVT